VVEHLRALGERQQAMPEAVIVSAARSPIGRAFKGSLKDIRPDDLAATRSRPRWTRSRRSTRRRSTT
jgi:hypothetical protein